MMKREYEINFRLNCGKNVRMKKKNLCKVALIDKKNMMKKENYLTFNVKGMVLHFL
jgi:hypothetical protein